MFTRQSLRQLANATSYSRGQSYYNNGSVTKLRREGDTFHAVVQGSRSYRVALRLAPAGPECTCTCPYDWDGICKHNVALGLAVLDGHQATDLQPAPPALAPAAASQLTTELKAAWAERKKGDKLRFLKQALAKSDDLARQFLGYGRQPVATSDEDLLADLPARLTETLETLEFDEELWENSESYYEDDEGEGLQEAADELLRETLAPFVAELLRVARAGQLTTALRYWTTANAAIYQLDEPASDDYGTFGHYGTDVLRHWHDDLATAGWPQVLLAAVLPPAELKAALKWLSQHLANPTDTWAGFEDSWRPLLLALAADPTAAPLLNEALAKAQLSPDTRAHLRLQLARTLPNDAAWAQAAETLLPTDPAVAQQLLHFYLTQTDRPQLLRAATTAFTTWPDRFGGFVLGTFTAAQAPDLFRAALRYRALANSSREDFTRLRPLLTPAAIQAFVREAVAAAQKRRDSVAFAAELLATETDTAALREFVLGLEWLFISPAQEMEAALALLAAADPTALMVALETRSRAYLNGHAGAKRGGPLYGAIGRWLALAHAAGPRLVEPALRLAQELREEFPTLHMLKDALRQHKLLPDKAVVAKEPAKRGRKPNPK
ncbi:SWIM zinc finger domain-containing protein [Hymenobacter artigasi]|uniref:SWIM-type domain-containing protein n=1 Tax=Hymenobacter artigasi TaxID=2719616 RepID=A0ABX1HKD1_9BACT|nr:hypothetical protein [Hymenobacter artigasi]NKI90733.1 hypothetical protein [Hymenobacter artigasi]